MSTKTELSPETKTRKHSAEAINRAMARFPLLVEILGELGKAQIPFPGDDDLHHGCDRTLTTMLAELARIEPAPSGKSSKAEENARGWLTGDKTIRLVDADKLQRIHQFIDRILGQEAN
ncbi:MAG: hypothetical protein ABIT37_00395 [Luteolibacter sp.]